MSLNAAAIETLLAKGLSGADILDVARALEKRADPTAATRMARMRAKRKTGDVTPVTVTPNTPLIEEDHNPPVTPLVISSDITPPAEISDDLGVRPEHVIEAWNMTAEPIGLQRVRKLTPERRRKLNTFIRRHTIDEITEGIAAIPRSPFLRGENARGWRADFDWMLEPKNFTKLTEGTYDR
jgi:hypothetical protein